MGNFIRIRHWGLTVGLAGWKIMGLGQKIWWLELVLYLDSSFILIYVKKCMKYQ
jgi:hypothetical protein